MTAHDTMSANYVRKRAENLLNCSESNESVSQRRLYVIVNLCESRLLWITHINSFSFHFGRSSTKMMAACRGAYVDTNMNNDVAEYCIPHLAWNGNDAISARPASALETNARLFVEYEISGVRPKMFRWKMWRNNDTREC